MLNEYLTSAKFRVARLRGFVFNLFGKRKLHTVDKEQASKFNV